MQSKHDIQEALYWKTIFASNVLQHRMYLNTKYFIQILLGPILKLERAPTIYIVLKSYRTHSTGVWVYSIYGSGHEGGAVLLPGFAIIW